MDLLEFRKKIDAIDDELLRLFEERMVISRQIALYKNEQGLPIRDAARESAKLSVMSEKAAPETRLYAEKLYAALFELSRAYQARIIHR
jgi:chorismate mutase/prephenate dehydratase